MNRTSRRLLAAGVSAIALSNIPALPAFAASYSGTFASDNPGSGAGSVTIDLSTCPGPNNTCGVIPPGVSHAHMWSVPNGWVIGTATGSTGASVSITNTGTANVIASGTDVTAGYAYATALNVGAIYENAVAGLHGAHPVSMVDLNNSGDLTVGGIAFASGSEARAQARNIFFPLINQFAIGGEDAFANLSNAGTLSVVESAHAIGNSDDAVAYATMLGGIAQHASPGVTTLPFPVPGESAVASLVNSGDLNIHVSAIADADNDTHFWYDGNARARLVTGISQSANADFFAAASLTNEANGDLSISAHAQAFGSDSADANARLRMGVVQHANAENASASIDNSGLFSVSALADAHGVDNVDASARITDAGVAQYATSTSSGAASVSLVNSGEGFNVKALATADAVNGTPNDLYGSDAYATARMNVGFFQYAQGSVGNPVTGDPAALVSLANTGSLGVEVGALAQAVEQDADARARLTGYMGGVGILQVASGTGAGPLLYAPAVASLGNTT